MKILGKTMGILSLALICQHSIANVPMPNCEDYQDDDRISLACNIYWEARNQSTEGMIAVASVTLHRVLDKRFPNTIAKVVWQKHQFSWTLDGKSDRPMKNEQLVWNKAWAISGMFSLMNPQKHKLCGNSSKNKQLHTPTSCKKVIAYQEHIMYNILPALDNTNGAVMYHADYAEPSWNKSKKILKTRKIDNHIFYVYK